ncbi:MAG: asparagine synthase (glutamine-hydrolyzing) [Bryobacterales bacterium]|nr:asparagine synthase (glutamine-hydrolyzing) [Bryobacterales bacterium]
MCGIAGYLSEPGSRPDRALIESMCHQIRHRGPDGYGYFHDGTATLGHTRLSIIDVEGGKQPLGNEDGSVQIVFNGEIYNFQQLHDDLVKRGHRFAGRSDTEVIVHLWEEAGERLPEYLNGMFSFAIWDQRRQQLFLARDRFGEKPLYYTTAVPGMRFCFASELKAMTVVPGFGQKLNPRAVADFLSFSYIPDPETIYENVYKLEPGRSLTVTANGCRKRRYWKPEFDIDGGANFERTVEGLEALAEDAVSRRMVSDVPLGGFLSGGVDSSAVVALMSRKALGTVKTFTIGFTQKQFDETRFARMVAGRYHTDHHETTVTPSVEDVLDTLVEHYDEPFGDSSAIPTLYLAGMTRRHVTVALSGDGADEVFGGYRRYRMGVAEDRARLALPAWFRERVVGCAARYYPKFDYLPRIFRAKATLAGISTGLAGAYYSAVTALGDGALAAMLSPEMNRARADYTPRAAFCERFQAYAHLPALQQMQAVDYETYLPGDILVKVDRATMAHSLESRAPWLDHRIAELAGRLPASYKLKGGVGKYVFKAAMRPHLPTDLLGRTKMGFSVPLRQWFHGSLKPVFEAAVLRPEMERYVSPREVKRIWAEHQAGFRNHQVTLWNLLMLARWDEHHYRQGRRQTVALEENRKG